MKDVIQRARDGVRFLRNGETTFVFTLLGIVILTVIAFWGTIGYVAFHFIAKFW